VQFACQIKGNLVAIFLAYVPVRRFQSDGFITRLALVQALFDRGLFVTLGQFAH